MSEKLVIMLTRMADDSGIRADWVHFVDRGEDGSMTVRIRGGSKQWVIPDEHVNPADIGGASRCVLTRPGTPLWDRARWQIQARAHARNLIALSCSMTDRGMDLAGPSEVVSKLREVIGQIETGRLS